MYSFIKHSAVTFILFLSLFVSKGIAQTVNGRVLSSKTGAALTNANIVQVGTKNGTSSAKAGRFSLQLIDDKSPKIRVSYVGYTTKVINIRSAKKPLIIKLSPRTYETNEVFVDALRADNKVPVASETIKKAEIRKKNLGRDLPYLLNSTPSAVVTSDAGAGIGYTGIRIRGVEPSRINVTINGIPVNDAESESVFWVDLPDLASSVESIQVQRGVGTSTNGAGAFGASINVQTSKMRKKKFGEVNAGIGSFNTHRYNLKLGSGLLHNGWQFQGRLSKTTSDGYIDRASSDLKSYYVSAAHHGDHGLLRADAFSGKEKTYQAYYGVPGDSLQTNRTFNPAGTEKPGDPYKNQTDNYRQDNYQLHYAYHASTFWKVNAALHFTYGRGYYEEYKADQTLTDYGLKPLVLSNKTITQSDLVRQQWLRNYFYGTIFSTKYQQGKWKLTLGGGYNRYKGGHFGKVIRTQFPSILKAQNGSKRYYDNDAVKNDGNLYAKLNYSVTPALNGYLDLQGRHIKYNFLGKDRQPERGGGQQIVDVQQTAYLNFFNPKVGFVYRLSHHQRIYASLSVGNKEPARDEYVNSTPRDRPSPETLYDWEGGYKASPKHFMAGVNFYYMDYKDQLIPTGEINDVGAVVRRNVPNSYRAGMELQGAIRIIPALQWSANVSLSRNKIKKYTQFLSDYDTGKQVPRTYENTSIAFSPSLIGNSIINYSLHAFTAALTTKYVSRQYLDNTQSKSRSIDPYVVNNLRISYNFGGVSVSKDIKATVQINNLFNEKYITNGSTFASISNGQRQFTNYYYPQAGTNFLARLRVAF